MTDTKDPNHRSVAEAKEWVKAALDENYQFKPIYLQQQKWIVVPVESGLHFDDNDVRDVAEAMRRTGLLNLYVVALEDLQEMPGDQSIEVSESGLRTFSRDYAHFNVALVPDHGLFTIVCTTGDYFLIAGPRRFVEDASGKDVATARECFERFASAESWSQSQRARLLSVSDRYA